MVWCINIVGLVYVIYKTVDTSDLPQDKLYKI